MQEIPHLAKNTIIADEKKPHLFRPTMFFYMNMNVFSFCHDNLIPITLS